MQSTIAGASRALALLAAFVAVSVVSGALFAGLFLPAVGAAGAAATTGVDFFNSLPAELRRPALSEQSVMESADGKVMASFAAENRIVIPLRKVAPVMQHAIVAIEDSRFYEHGGIDPHGVLRAVLNNQMGNSVQGASTLTQQYIKNVNLEAALLAGDENAQKAATSKDNARKLHEMRQAITLEKSMTKDQILENYLNIVPFGGTIYGVEAAASHFFGVNASALTLPQAATLAGLVQAPTTYNPLDHPAAATARRNIVLDRMYQLKVISQQDYAAAVATKMVTSSHKTPLNCISAGNQAYFCDYVYNTLLKDPGYSVLGKTEAARRQTILRGGLIIKTTIQPWLQGQAAAAAAKRLPVLDNSHVATAAVTVDPRSGYVLAMTQNRIYASDNKQGDTEINFAVDHEFGNSNGFQTGSTFKSFTLATWLKKGNSLNDFIDATQTSRPYSDFSVCGSAMHDKRTYDFNNSESSETGQMTVLKATADSVNTAFVDIESRLDLCDIADTAKSLGVHLATPMAAPTAESDCSKNATSSEIPRCYPTMTLGPFGISPLTMASAYGGFANNGTWCRPMAVTQILDRNEKPLKVPGGQCNQALDPDVAHGVSYALKRVLTEGTGGRIGGLGRPVAGKTGTTNGSLDTWFVGYTPQRVTAVWVADPTVYKEGRHELRHITINGQYYRSVFGADIAGKLWRDIMEKATAGLPELDWANPPAKMLQGAFVHVPDVTGASPGSAIAILQGQGFKTKISRHPEASTVAAGLVSSTSPSAGSPVAPNSMITINISDGSLSQGGNGNGGGKTGGGGGGGIVTH